MPTIAWLVIGAGAWVAAVCATCGLLIAAARAGARLQPPVRLIAERAEVAAACWRLGDMLDLLGPRVSAIVVALREPRPAGPVVAIAASGAATPLLGRMLAPDDHLSARVVLSGRREARGHAAAAPLYRGEHTIGAIEITISPQHAPLTARDLDRLTRAADAISAALTTMAAASAHDAPPQIPG
jgi:hypothetical protein